MLHHVIRDVALLFRVTLLLPSTHYTVSAPRCDTSQVPTYFEVHSQGSYARCLRFAVTVTRLLLYDHARLASGW